MKISHWDGLKIYIRIDYRSILQNTWQVSIPSLTPTREQQNKATNVVRRGKRIMCHSEKKGIRTVY
jgi:hypothetical protein